MTDTEHDKIKIRKIFDQFTEMSKTEFKTEIGKVMGEGLKQAIKQAIKPYMVELSKRI